MLVARFDVAGVLDGRGEGLAVLALGGDRDGREDVDEVAGVDLAEGMPFVDVAR